MNPTRQEGKWKQPLQPENLQPWLLRHRRMLLDHQYTIHQDMKCLHARKSLELLTEQGYNSSAILAVLLLINQYFREPGRVDKADMSMNPNQGPRAKASQVQR